MIELLGLVGPLTDPTAHGGRAEEAADVVLPSLPGTASAASQRRSAGTPGRVPRAWAELMNRLGYTGSARVSVASAEERKRLWPRVNRHNMDLAPIMHPGARGRYDVYQRHTTREIPVVLLERNPAES